ncbi:MAG: 30S ribosomal protein S1, partial [Parcubacteria group bacterium Gr01-1014_106]
MTPRRAAQIGTQQQNADSPFARLLAAHPDALRALHAGDIVKGTVLEIAPSSLYVDLGSQGVGIVFGRELLDAADTFRMVRIGDDIEAVVLDPENDQGYIELSLRSASEEKSWARLEARKESGEIFPAQIMDANKGGLIIRLEGITGFLPVSQLSAEHYPRVEGGDKQQIFDRLKQYVGQLFNVRVLTADRREGKLIVSEKAAMTAEMEGALGDLKERTEVEGVVSGIVDFGVFIKFQRGGQDLEGLVHISELAWQRVDDPKDYASVGQKVRAVVLAVEG